jgi:hypothetical protein
MLQGTEFPSKRVVVHHEEVEIGSWRQHVQMEAFKAFLLSGFDIHLSTNQGIRDVFDLGAPKQVAAASSKSKVRQHAFKKRLCNEV